MRYFKDKKIGARLTLLTVSTTTVALLCVVVAFFVLDYRLLMHAKAVHVSKQLAMLEQNAATATALDNPQALQRMLWQSVDTGGFLAIRVYGDTIDFSFPADAFSDPNPPRGFLAPRDFTRKLFMGGKYVADLQVRVSYADVRQRVYYLLIYTAMAFALALMVAYLLARWVQRLVSAPLEELQELSKAVIESGDYAVRTQVDGTDEIGQLGRAFNRMLGHIQQRDLLLEKQVSQRTRELQSLAEGFRYRALHDSLTGLPNRALLLEEFSRASFHANRVAKHFALLMLDLDNFKGINDTWGHDAGDDLLQQVARKIRNGLRGEDLVCRLGGDEFVVLLEDVENDQAIVQVAEALMSRLGQGLTLNGKPLDMKVSIGASIYPEHGRTLDDLKHNADIAMYRAKEAGKNRLVIFDAEIAQEANHKLLLQQELKSAIARAELELHFQPQVDLLKGRVVGCEAFLRWHHQGLGFMQPADFMDSAEESGMIQKIDYFVLREAARTCHEWREQFGRNMPIAVNISSSHFRTNSIVEVVSNILQDYPVPPHYLTLELRDDLLLSGTSEARWVLAQLRGLGVRFSLGDFGVGYFSLDHWRNAKVSAANLHRSIIRQVETSTSARKFIKAVLRFARELDITVVAQGVESDAQLTQLAEMGCRYMQGFNFTPPLRGGEFLRWLDAYEKSRQPGSVGRKPSGDT